MRHWFFSLLFFLAACSHAQLQRAGDGMIKVERATSAVVDGAVAFKDEVKADCVAQDLQTAEERKACVEPAYKVLDVVEPGTAGIRAKLVTFWSLYVVLETKIQSGEKLNADDIAKLVKQADAVVAAYRDVLKSVAAAKGEAQ